MSSLYSYKLSMRNYTISRQFMLFQVTGSYFSSVTSYDMLASFTALHQAHGYRWPSLRFYRELFVNHMKSWKCTPGPVESVNSIIKDVRGPKLLLTTASAYPVNCVCFCHLLKTQHCCLYPNGRYSITHVWLSTHLIPPLSHPPTPLTQPSFTHPPPYMCHS